MEYTIVSGCIYRLLPELKKETKKKLRNNKHNYKKIIVS